MDIESLLVEALNNSFNIIENSLNSGVPQRDKALQNVHNILHSVFSFGQKYTRPADTCAQLCTSLWNCYLTESYCHSAMEQLRQLAAMILLLFAERSDQNCDDDYSSATKAHRLPVDNAQHILLSAAVTLKNDDAQSTRAMRLIRAALAHTTALKMDLERKLTSFTNHALTLYHLNGVEMTIFSCRVLQSEMWFSSKQHELAHTAADEALATVANACGEQQLYLQQTLFNFALSRYNEHQWSDAIDWLQKSTTAGSNVTTALAADDLQWWTLDLMARCHIRLGGEGAIQSALQLLQLLFAARPSLNTRLLILECVLQTEQQQQQQQQQQTEEQCTMDAKDWCRSAHDYALLHNVLLSHSRKARARQLLEEYIVALDQKQVTSNTQPHVHALLVDIYSDEESISSAIDTLKHYICILQQTAGEPAPSSTAVWHMVQKIESAVMNAHQRTDTSATANCLKQLEAICTEYKEMARERYGDDCHMDELSVKVHARLLRNLARSLCSVDAKEQALNSVRHSLRLEPDHSSALFLLIYLQLSLDRQQSALDTMKTIGCVGDHSRQHDFIRKLCGYTIAHSMGPAFTELSKMVVRLSDNNDLLKIDLLQYLVRACCEPLEALEDPTEEHYQSLVDAFELALEHVKFTTPEATSKAVWLSNTAWNIASLDNVPHRQRHRLFRACATLRATVSREISDVSLCCTATLMAAAALLIAIEEEQKKDGVSESSCSLSTVMDCVGECKTMLNTLGSAANGWPYHNILLLLEIQASKDAEQSSVARLVQLMTERKEMDCQCLEVAAGVMVGQGRHTLALQLWSAAADRLIGSGDYVPLHVRCVSRVLVPWCPVELQIGECLLALLSRLCDTVELSAERRGSNMHMLYLTCRIWNQAVQFSLQQNTQCAVRWARLAQRFVPLLAAQRQWYAQHMQKGLAAIQQVAPGSSTDQHMHT